MGWEEKLDRIENLLRLAAAAKDGRPDALGELLAASAGIVHALARSRLGDTLLAEEAAQAALTRAARGFPKLRNPRTWPAWLKTIALRSAADAARRAVDPLPAAAVATRVDPGPGPVATAIGSERAVLVRRAVDRLPARLRDPVLLAYSEDLGYREIAKVVGTSPATVTRRIAAAHARLRALLGDEP